uniref:Dynein regulatory complex protein 10 n=1 Tax=Phallusia mammillata TaxID=59560 RepID=A0A6F9DFI0_9ASCI|nr:IQ domain-containing protein D-like [Phallusia mammillata]
MTDVLYPKLEAIGENISPFGHKKLGNTGRIDSGNSQQGVSAALRILEPTRKKLATVETQRIIECLDDCIRRHELCAALLYILIPKEEVLEKYSLALGVELTTAIKSHRTLCHMLEESIELQDDKTASLHNQINESCKNIMRLFSQNPTISTAIRGEYSQHLKKGYAPLANTAKLITNLIELRAIMFERLLTTPVEETDRSKYLLQVSEREKSNETIIDKLQTQLDAAIDDKEQELSKRNETIRRLKNDLHQIEQFSEEHVRRTKTEADKQQAADSRSSDGKQSKLLTEMEQLQDQLNRMLQENREVEQALRKRKYKIETEVDNWITKYDQDMGEKQDEYEQIDEVYTKEKKQLSELEEKFQVLEEEYNKIMEERRIAQAEKEARELELALMIKVISLKQIHFYFFVVLLLKYFQAAITVQAFFRAYKVRKALKSKAKKGGKGKGKKKK